MHLKVDSKERSVSFIPENDQDRAAIDKFVEDMDACDMRMKVARVTIDGKKINVYGVTVFSPRADH